MFDSLYEFSVHEALLNGVQVMCMDKQEGVLYDLLKLPVDEYIGILKTAAEDRENRFLFYYWKEGKADDAV